MELDRLQDAVAAVGTRPNAEELAQMLWLSLAIARHAPPSPGVPDRPPPAPAEPRRGVPPPPDPALAEQAPPIRPGRAEGWENLPLYARRAARTTGARTAVEVVVPPAPMLADKLAFTRALRPLRRRVPAPVRQRVDEDATAEAIAEQRGPRRRFLPTLRPDAERWLDAALVVDTSESMRIWRRLARECGETLVQSGVFRDVTWWRVDGGATGAPVLTSVASPARRRPAELLDPRGRRVIFVLSDCVGAMWRSGRAATVLHRWAGHGPVVIVQPLPERMWGRTGASTIAGQLSAGWGGVPNARLRFDPYDGMSFPADETPVPVVQASPGWLARWGRLVGSGQPQPSAVTFVAPTEPVPIRRAHAASVSARDRVLNFRGSASREAFRLAGYVAMTRTPSLPIISLVHASMTQRPEPAHVAEVVLSGLLRVAGPDGEYAFVDGVENLLLDTVSRQEALRVEHLLDGVAAKIEELSASTHRDMFRALLGMPGGPTSPDPASRPFALLSDRARDRLQALSGIQVLPPPPAAPVPSTVEDDDAAEPAPEGAPAGPVLFLSPRPRAASALLAPDAGVVRFAGRERELRSLSDWCRQPGSPIRLLTGRAGEGKTRLALALIERLRADGWVAGVLARDADLGQVTRLLSDVDTPALVVVDEADVRPGQTRALLELPLPSPGGQARRVLVLARSAGDWWDDLWQGGAAGPLPAGTTVERLAPLAGEPDDRATLARPATEDFAAALSVSGDVPLSGLREAAYDNVLNLHEAALRGVLARTPAHVASAVQAAVETATLAREREYWLRSATQAHLSYPSTSVLEECVAVLHLYGAQSAAEARDLMRRLLGEESGDRPTQYARWLHELYPGRQREYWGDLVPRAFWDQHVAGLVADHPERFGGLLDHASSTQAARFREIAGWAAPAYPEDPEPAAQLTARPVLADRDLSVDEVRRAIDALPPDDPSLTPADVEAANRLVGHLTRLATATTGYEVLLARARVHLAELLLRDGESLQAATVAEQAVGAWRPLVDANPTARRPALARALRVYASALADLNRPAEGLATIREALQIYRLLRAEDETAHLPGFAATLHETATLRCLNGDYVRGHELFVAAIHSYRHLLTIDSRYDQELADALTDHGTVLAYVQPAAAAASLMEAARYYERRLGDEPDDEESRHSLSRCYRALAGVMRSSGDTVEAGRYLAKARDLRRR